MLCGPEPPDLTGLLTSPGSCWVFGRSLGRILGGQPPRLFLAHLLYCLANFCINQSHLDRSSSISCARQCLTSSRLRLDTTLVSGPRHPLSFPRTCFKLILCSSEGMAMCQPCSSCMKARTGFCRDLARCSSCSWEPGPTTCPPAG